MKANNCFWTKMRHLTGIPSLGMSLHRNDVWGDFYVCGERRYGAYRDRLTLQVEDNSASKKLDLRSQIEILNL